jgi:RNA polymerase subunit RPABC4/transcription elongation factor Spt4
MKKKCNNCKAELTEQDKDLCSLCESRDFLDLIDR